MTPNPPRGLPNLQNPQPDLFEIAREQNLRPHSPASIMASATSHTFRPRNGVTRGACPSWTGCGEQERSPILCDCSHTPGRPSAGIFTPTTFRAAMRRAGAAFQSPGGQKRLTMLCPAEWFTWPTWCLQPILTLRESTTTHANPIDKATPLGLGAISTIASVSWLRRGRR